MRLINELSNLDLLTCTFMYGCVIWSPLKNYECYTLYNVHCTMRTELQEYKKVNKI